MSFDWTKYLDLAKQLYSASDDASLRSAVSRSYYCAFNLARARAESKGYRAPHDDLGSSHDKLWELYGRNEDSDECKRLAIVGPRLKKKSERYLNPICCGIRGSGFCKQSSRAA